MTENLNGIIDFINDNILYGSKVTEEKVQSFINIYHIPFCDQHSVYNELKELNISIIHTQHSHIEVLKKLLKVIGENKNISEETLLEWYGDHGINKDTQLFVRQSLLEAGFTITSALEVQQNDSDLDFLNDPEFDKLNTILDDENFKKEVSFLEEVATKTKNDIYLNNYHSDTGNVITKSEALDNLVQANKKLVWKMVLKYKKFATNTFDLDDMYQVGMLGLIKAVERFDSHLGNQFSTYATWWVRQGITRGLYDHSTTIRIPVHRREKIVKLISTENKFWSENSRLATDKELALLMNIPIESIRELKKYKKIANLTSLETTVGPDENTELEDFISSDSAQGPEFYVETMALESEIKQLLKKRLTDKERLVLSLRYGLEDSNYRTLEETGRFLGVTRERIRQIESRAIKKLKKYNTLEILGDFYYDNR